MRTRIRVPDSGETHRLSGPGELLQAVPYLLGFHPRRSLVLVGLHDGALVVTARLDLPDASVPGVLEHTAAALARGGTSTVIAAVYDDAAIVRPGARPWTKLADAVAAAVGAADCSLLDVLLVAGERWWSLCCSVEECCPPEGQPLPDAPSAFAAAATYSGVVALPDRDALAALLDPVPDSERERLDPAIKAAQKTARREALDGHGERAERRAKRTLFAAARQSDAGDWPGLTDDAVARFGAALAVDGLRDAVWLAVDERRLDGRPLWRELARRLPRPYDAPALFLYGWAAWRSGDGTLAGIAAERAVASDPQFSPADLLLAALTHGLDPRSFPKLRKRPA